MTPPIAIIGAGPSGLTLGRLLELANIDYVIFERDTPPKPGLERTGTLDIHVKDGQLALREAGLLDEFQKIARYDAPTLLADSTGKVIISLGEDRDRPEIDRKDLRSLLLGSIPPHRVRWDSKVQQVRRHSEESMAISFDDGSVESGFKLVVGADGAWSKTRRLITSTKPRYSGMYYLTMGIKATNPFHSRLAPLIGQGTYLAMGGGKQVIGQLLGDGSFYTGVGLSSLPEDFDAKTALADPSAFRERLLRDEFADFAEEQRDLIKHSEGEIYPWPLYEMPVDSLSWESVPGVTVIGDAAHVSIPSGEGVNIAMLDSLQLAQQIVQHGLDGLDRAVAEYEKMMLPRAKKHMAAAEQGKLLWAPNAPHEFLKASRTMRLVVLGGNGRTGVHLIDRALGRGHQVAALVRDPSALPERKGLDVFQGTPQNLDDVCKAFRVEGHPAPDAVIVTLNPSRATDSPLARPMAPPRFMANSVANAITAMRQHHVPKIVVMQALGVGDSFPNMSVWMRYVRHWTYMKHSYDDHDLVDEEIRVSGINYVLPRPPWLTNGEAGPVRTFGNTGTGVGNLATVSRKSVADFLLDACERSDWDRSTPVIAS
ncbi:hypothetical protein LTR36_007873 [Oleoguttula mirabilis]|uniref:FAD-binding domain-containing protein n=1 Tax=Oleoguttula mirabilis TaxID=1507867 RepID=A0AAV9J9Y3_9PEZI|nr:hypothetical protein LTR36_007873 [Oleoguttula mirabilis]